MKHTAADRPFPLRIYEGFPRCKLLFGVLGALGWLALTLLAGGSLTGLLLTAAAAVFYFLLPGRTWRRLLRLDAFLPDFSLPLSAVLGIGSTVALYCFAMRLGMLWALRILPPVFGLAGLALYRPARPALSPGAKTDRCALALLLGALLFVYGWAGAVKYTHPAVAGEILLNQDFLWNVGNAESFLIQFPPQDIRFFNVRLHYHYLTELIAACFSLVTGVACYDILAFYQQPLLLGLLVECLYRFGCFYFRKDGETDHPRALLFVWSLFCFGCAGLWKLLPNGMSPFWNSNIAHLITNINSQTTAVIFLSIFTALFFAAADRRFRIGPIPFCMIAATFFLLCFAKGPVAAIVACAVVLTVLFLLFEKKANWRGALLAVVLGAMFTVIYITMFSSGANTSMRLTLAGTLEKSYFQNYLALWYKTSLRLYRIMLVVLVPVQTLLALPAAIPLFVHGGWRNLKQLLRLDARQLLPTACAVGGLLAFFLFNHPAMSQVYFLLMAVFFFDLLAVEELAHLSLPDEKAAKHLPRLIHRVWLWGTAALACIGLITAGFTYVNLCGSGLRQLLRNYDVWEKYPYECVMTADDEAAAAWLRENTDAATCRFATNRIHTGGRLEGISNLYSALSGRQGFMEGFQYAVTNMGVSEKAVAERLTVNDLLFSADSTAEEILAACREWGITHILYSRQMIGDESQLTALPCVYCGPDVRIYAVPDA